MAKRDYYLVLGIPPIAPPEDIKKAYRALSKKYHPDANPNNKAEADKKMKELIEAYNILNDQQKRKDYDAQPQFKVRRFAKSSARTKTKSNTQEKQKSLSNESPVLRFIKKLFDKESNKNDGPVTDPKQADVHFTLGLSMSETGSFMESACKEFKLALKFDPNHKEACYNMGLMYYKIGDFDNAVSAFEKCLEISGGEDPAARVMLASLKS